VKQHLHPAISGSRKSTPHLAGGHHCTTEEEEEEEEELMVAGIRREF
jgi:hypothetical protein